MVLADRGITHGMRYQARALAPISAEVTKSCWLAGTTALREENEVDVLEFDTESDALVCTASYSHPAEIWSLASCPEDPELLITVFNESGVFGATLWKRRPGATKLEEQAQLSGAREGGGSGGPDTVGPGGRARIHSALWRQGGVVATVEDRQLRCWQIGEGDAKEIGSLQGRPDASLAGGAWDPLDTSRLASIAGGSIQLWDVRSFGRAGDEVKASEQPLRDCSFAAQSPNVLSTVGDDCQLRCWDLRRTGGGPLVTVSGHTRWVWRVRHNPVHDSLVITSSADCAVGLHYLPGVRAAAAQGRAVNAGTMGRASHNGRVHTADDHEEAVYGAEWSAADPWVFASLSYDGRVVVNRVPSAIKYKILI